MISDENDRPLLVAEGLTKYYGRQLGCRDASFELYEGEVMAVVGESGSGKSTLLQMLSTQIEPARSCERSADVRRSGAKACRVNGQRRTAQV